MAKLIPRPNYPELPKTDAANVKENIDLWLEAGKESTIKAFLRPDPKGHKGYRFVNSEDLSTRDKSQIIISDITLQLEFHRVVSASGSLDPLYFIERGWGVFIYYENFQIDYKSDAQLKRVLHGIKTDPYKGNRFILHDYKNNIWTASGTRNENATRYYSRYTGR